MIYLYTVLAVCWAFIFALAWSDDQESPEKIKRTARLFLLFPVWPIPLVWFLIKLFHRIIKCACGKATDD